MLHRMVHFYDNEFHKGIYVEEVHVFNNLGRQKWSEAGRDKIMELEARLTQIILVMVIIIPKWILWCCVAFIFVASPYVTMGVSVWRLVRRDYYSSDAGGHLNRASRAKLNAALDIFYALALFHSFFVIYWMKLGMSLPDLNLVLEECGFGKWGPNVIGMYYSETQKKLRKDGELPDKWNLITYSIGLLQSASEDDQLWGARVLDELFDKDDSVRKELLPYRQSIQNLIAMVGTDKIENSERAARIVAHLANDLHMAQFSGILQCTCYLLEKSSCKQYFEPQVTLRSEHPEQRLPDKMDPPGSREISEHQGDASSLSVVIIAMSPLERNKENRVQTNISLQFQQGFKIGYKIGFKIGYGHNRELIKLFQVPMNNPRERRKFLDPHSHPYEHKGAKELISQGLLILERLTQDEENCTEITKHQRLLSKITSPLRSRDFLSNAAMVEMVSKSLTVVSRLLTSPGDGATRLRQQLASNKEAVSNLMAILKTYREGAEQLHQDALEILTELALDDSFKNLDLNELFEALLNIFPGKDASDGIEPEQVDGERTTRLRGKAGDALARLLPVRTAAARRANVADVLSKQKQEAINLLTKALHQILCSKMGTNADAATGAGASTSCAAETMGKRQPRKEADSVQPHTQGDKQISDERKLMASMLSLALVIGNENVISGKDFACAIPEDEALVKKFIEILKVNKHNTAECLKVVKLTCQMVIAMIQAKPDCIRHFNEHFKEALSKAVTTMKEIDDCMLFAGNDREVIKPARSLASLVKEADKLLGTSIGKG
ncbi:hypothetical protein HU200_000436 [Digitaria exilis]|uniref:Uncharacterized protein n=1 Tax=Digitaria exilis TaxID=1010633 RepID=A0A835G0L8_9POAL|nr:hypothetical protein HU200_000436 [Digitaria exilis]